MTSPRKITILGATGSVGQSTVDLVLSEPERFAVQAVTCNKNIERLAEQAKKLKAKRAVTADPALYEALKEKLAGSGIEAAAGPEAIIEAALMPADWTMAAIVGIAGLKPIMAAITQGNIVAIANKEPLVAAGPLVKEAAAKAGATLLPVDSEHNAVFQVFDQNNREAIDKIILTASGGPFLKRERESLANITPEEAVKHPNWSMGAKISVDSATMMNKALEVIEAHYLFDFAPEQIDVLIHPQSVIHSLVAYQDGSVLAQMGAPDMRTPIAHALAWPKRMATTGDKLDLTQKISLELQPIDKEQFPALSLAYEALKAGPAACIAFNAANEIAVEAFLNQHLKFLEIYDVVENAVNTTALPSVNGLEEVILLDRTVREKTQNYIVKLQDNRNRAA